MGRCSQKTFEQELQLQMWFSNPKAHVSTLLGEDGVRATRRRSQPGTWFRRRKWSESKEEVD